MKITLHIERVVLDGMPLEHPRTLRKAIERELAGRLREGGLSPEFRAGGAVSWVRGGAIEQSDGLFALRCFDDAVPFVFQRVPREEPIGLVVVDDHDRRS